MFCCASLHTIADEVSEPQNFNVLYLNAYHRGYSWSDEIERGLHEAFEASGKKINLYSEYLDTKRFPSLSHLPLEADNLAQKYAQFHYDLVVLSDNNALDFALQYRQRLFPDVPIVFCGYNNFTPEVLKGVKNITGIAETIDFRATIDLALELHPATQQLIFIASDFRNTTAKHLQTAQQLLPQYQTQYQTHIWLNHSIRELEIKLAQVSKSALVFIIGEAVDFYKSGFFSFEEYTHRLTHVSHAPMYTMWHFYLGNGVMGGNIITGFEQGRKSAELGLQILSGQSADSLSVLTQTPAVNILDYQVMQRFGISESLVPTNTQIINHPPNLYTQYRLYFWLIGIALFILLLILLVLSELLRRLHNKNRRLEVQQQIIRDYAEARYRSLVNAMGEGMVVYEQDGAISMCNTAAEHILGLRQEEIMKHWRSSLTPCWRLVYEDGSTCPSEQHPAVVTLRTGQAQHNVVFGICKAEDKLSWIQMNTQPIFHENEQQVHAVVATFADITEHKRIEAELKESEQRLYTAGKAAYDLIYEWDVSSNHLEWFGDVDTLLGYKQGYISRNTGVWLDLIHPADVHQLQEALGIRYSSAQPIDYEYRVKHQDGIYRYWVDRALPLLDKAGNPYKWVGVCSDMTQHKQAEQALRDSQAKLLQAQYIAGLGDFVWNIQDNSVVWSEGLYQLLKYDKSELIDFQKINTEIHHPEDLPEISEWLTTSIESGRTTLEPKEYRLVCQDGEVIYVQTNGFIEYQNGKAHKMFGTCLNITERKHFEMELIQAREEAEAANRAKSSFLANMSHELRTPLNAMLGFAQLMKMDIQLGKRHRHNVQNIHRSGEFLLEQINDILDLAKIEAGGFELLPQTWYTSIFFNELYDLFRIRAEQKSLKLNYQADVHLPKMLYSDNKRLRQIIMNLLGNAIKFTHQGNIHLDVKFIKGDLHIVISDTGVGIPSDMLETIFEPFQQVGDISQKTQGTGLGLAITRKLIQGMHGEISVSSVVGTGSQFHVQVPVEVVSTQTEARESTTEQPFVLGYQRCPHSKPLRVLVCDDVANNREVLHELLKPLGFDISEAENGQKCLECAQQQRPDAILLDIYMPDINGLQVTQRLRHLSDLHDIAIIAITAHAFNDIQQKSLDAGCDAYLSKPVQLPKLLDILANLLKLEWQYSHAEENEDNTQHLSSKQIQQFLEMLDQGNITGIMSLVDELENSDCGSVLVHQISELAQNFNLNELKQLIDSLCSTSNATHNSVHNHKADT